MIFCHWHTQPSALCRHSGSKRSDQLSRPAASCTFPCERTVNCMHTKQIATSRLCALECRAAIALSHPLHSDCRLQPATSSAGQSRRDFLVAPPARFLPALAVAMLQLLYQTLFQLFISKSGRETESVECSRAQNEFPPLAISQAGDDQMQAVRRSR